MVNRVLNSLMWEGVSREADEEEVDEARGSQDQDQDQSQSQSQSQSQMEMEKEEEVVEEEAGEEGDKESVE